MLKINNIYYELNIIDIIKELKEQLAINGIYLFNQIKELPTDLMVTCPFHKDGQERKASCRYKKRRWMVALFKLSEKVAH